MKSIVHILSDARGIYIPRDFLTDNYNEIAESHCVAWGLTEDNKQNWLNATDPDSEFYWDDWEWILNNAKFIDEDGSIYKLYQDGDLWGICYEKLTDDEKLSFFGEL